MDPARLRIVSTFFGQVRGGHCLYWSSDNRVAVLGHSGVYIMDPDFLFSEVIPRPLSCDDRLQFCSPSALLVATTSSDKTDLSGLFDASLDVESEKGSAVLHRAPPPSWTVVLLLCKPSQKLETTAPFITSDQHRWLRFSREHSLHELTGKEDDHVINALPARTPPVPRTRARRQKPRQKGSDAADVDHDAVSDTSDKGRIPSQRRGKKKTLLLSKVPRGSRQTLASSTEEVQASREQGKAADASAPGAAYPQYFRVLHNYYTANATKSPKRYSVFAWSPPLRLHPSEPPSCLFLTGTSNGAALEIRMPRSTVSTKESQLVFDIHEYLSGWYEEWVSAELHPLAAHVEPSEPLLSFATASSRQQRASDGCNFRCVASRQGSDCHLPLEVFNLALLQFKATWDPETSAYELAGSFHSFPQWIHDTLGTVNALYPTAAAMSPNTIRMPIPFTSYQFTTPSVELPAGCLCVVSFYDVATLWWITESRGQTSASAAVQIGCVGSIQLPTGYNVSPSPEHLSSSMSHDLITAVALSPLYAHEAVVNVSVYLGTGNGSLFAYVLTIKPPGTMQEASTTMEVCVTDVDRLLSSNQTPITSLVTSHTPREVNCGGGWTLVAAAGQHIFGFLGHFQHSSSIAGLGCRHQQAEPHHSRCSSFLLHTSNITGLQCVSTVPFRDALSGVASWITHIHSLDAEGCFLCHELSVRRTSDASYRVSLRLRWKGTWDAVESLLRCDYVDQTDAFPQNDDPSRDAAARVPHIQEPQYLSRTAAFEEHIPPSIHQQKRAMIPRLRGLGVSPNGIVHCVIRDFSGSQQFSVTGGLLDLALGNVPLYSVTQAVLHDILAKMLYPLLRELHSIHAIVSRDSRPSLTVHSLTSLVAWSAQRRRPLYWATLRTMLGAADCGSAKDLLRGEQEGPNSNLQRHPAFHSSVFTRRYKEIMQLVMKKRQKPVERPIAETTYSCFGDNRGNSLLNLLIDTIGCLELPWEPPNETARMTGKMETFGFFFVFFVDRLQNWENDLNAATRNSNVSKSLTKALILALYDVLQCILRLIETPELLPQRPTSAPVKEEETVTTIEPSADPSPGALLHAYVGIQLNRCLTALWSLIEPSAKPQTHDECSALWWTLKKSLIRTYLRASTCLSAKESLVFSTPEALRQSQLEKITLRIETGAPLSSVCPYCDSPSDCFLPYTTFSCQNPNGQSHSVPLSVLTMSPFRGQGSTLHPSSWGCSLCGHMFEWTTTSPASSPVLTPFTYDLPQTCPLCFGNTQPLNRYTGLNRKATG